MKKNNILLHIGYHKTGTTFLQESYFKNSQFNLLCCNSNNFKPSKVLKLIYEPPHIYTKQNWDVKDNICNVLTFESLSGGYLWCGNSSETFNTFVARRLKDEFEEAKILIVIREQFKMLESMYWQYIWEGGTLSYNNFIKNSLSNKGFFNAYHLAYDYLIKEYQNLFGKDNVLVLPYEMMKKDYDNFFKRISSFSKTIEDIPENKEYNKSKKGKFVYGYIRFLNLFFGIEAIKNNRKIYRLRRFFTKFNIIINMISPKMNFKMDQEYKNQLNNIYSKSNKELKKITNIDLDDYCTNL